jgi:EAL domain-containing protein (putative c-di-GMP-specific phosphodiesterase class I)
VRLHSAERDRLDSLASYDVVGTGPQPELAAVTALAAEVCDVPIAAVSVVDADTQWFASLHGADLAFAPRDGSFCGDVVADNAVLVVPDALADPRFRSLPSVVALGIRAYVGVPLVGRDGLPLGTLCVFDVRPRAFTDRQLATLADLARMVVLVFEQRRRDGTDGLRAAGVVDEARDPRRLRQALDSGELVPWFQPLVDIRSGRPHGLESLLRWQHPELGTLPPSAFLPAVEASALVVPVGRAVLDAAVAQVAVLRRRGICLPGGVAVNVASGQLARPGLAADVVAALSRHGVRGSQLAVEITESTSLPDPELARAELDQLVLAGVRIVIDDYGLGWSNLSRVLELPVSTLKLDRSIAGAVDSDPRAALMVRSTVAMATSLGLDVVAEGVETPAARRVLADAGCAWAQGWLFSAAVSGQALPGALGQLTARAVALDTCAVPVR